ncbi:MAG: 5-oxoprolinase subunit PxpB, partial [Solirubrobacteraceae bacterium]
LGDRAVTITLGDSIDEPTHRLVRAVTAAIDARRPRGVTEQVPAFASVTVHYDPGSVAGDPTRSPYARVVEALEQLLGGLRVDDVPPPRVVEIPVCYGGELGPDLEDIARRHALTADDVVEIHTAGDYLVYMVGFMPGFAYLGGLSDRIATPRRASPRTAVPAGTVGIGGNQTGVYPLESPGGWNLIGRTPLRIFDLSRDEHSLLKAGDRVRFRSISLSEFRREPGGS